MINKKSISAIVTAIAASLCCITPFVAIFAGSTSFAASFSWMHPFRPYLIGLTIIILVFAWWDKLKIKKLDIACVCEEDGKISFYNTKKFLAIITLFAIVMLTFPQWGTDFIRDNKLPIIIVKQANIVNKRVYIKGMTCGICEATIDKVVSRVHGVLSVKASAPNGDAIIQYDKSKTNIQTIMKTIASTGYVPTEYKNIKMNK